MLIDGRKVAGILAEGRPQEGWAVLGIGVNAAVAPDDLVAGAGTLGRARGELEAALAELLLGTGAAPARARRSVRDRAVASATRCSGSR